MTRMGVIGYGYWGPNLARNFSDSPRTELVAVGVAGAAALWVLGLPGVLVIGAVTFAWRRGATTGTDTPLRRRPDL